MQGRDGHAIDKVYCSGKGIKPERWRKGGMGKQGESRLDDVTVFPFSDAVLFWGVGT